MIKAQHIALLHPVFKWIVNGYVNRHFKKVIYKPISFNTEQSVLLIANHFSWWDGFLSYYVQAKIFKKKFHVLVLEHTLRKHILFRWAGAFSIRKGNKSAINSLQYVSELLQNANNLVLIYPQGKLYSNHIPELKMEKGMAKILEFSQYPLQVIFQVTVIDYFASRKPSAFIYFKVITLEKETNLRDLEQQYNRFYQEVKSQHVQQSV